MPRYVAMIPARLGSKRVKKKNLRLLGNRPLIAYAIEAVCASGEFDDVYVNSEAEVFKEVADQFGAKFYRRPAELASDEATNDQFALDFMDHVPCDVLVQINPTSPFISADDIRRAKERFEKRTSDTVLAVKEARIEGVLKGQPLNFDPKRQMPRSQDLEPIYLFCNGILAWRTEVFRQNMAGYGCAVYGGKGKTTYLVLKGDATLDIDGEEDFALAELVLQQRERPRAFARYWEADRKREEHAETHVGAILTKDGVTKIDLEDVNHSVTHLADFLTSDRLGQSWSKRIINSPSNSMTIICQMPGEGNRLHYHKDWDEWWFILEGEWEYEVDGRKYTVRQGDVVFIERNRLHKATVMGNSRGIRMAVSRDGIAHIYPSPEGR